MQLWKNVKQKWWCQRPEDTRDVNEAASKAVEVIDEEEEPKGDDKFILETFVDEKDMNLSKTDRTRSFTKEEEMLKNVSVIKKKENAKG